MNNRPSYLPMVLVISCTHAMVHIVEQSFSSVEQIVSGEFQLTMEQSGQYGSVLRIPFGFGAFITGMLADRIGASRVLSLYLTGTAIVCLSFAFTTNIGILGCQLFAMGVFASMYHPAGLSLMTSITTPKNRALALGIHGIFGSGGLMGAPLIAALVLLINGATWHTFFLTLGILAAGLVVVFRWGVARFSANAVAHAAATSAVDRSPGDLERERIFSPDRLQVGPFLLLMSSTACSGIVYGGVLHFLKRYLSDVKGFDFLSANPDSVAGYLTAMALACGAGGQFFSGVIATPRRLAPMLSLIYLANVPLLLWMSAATESMRLIPCCLLGFVHFMNQPVYNSLLPDYVPAKTRSTWFGFSQMMTFGIGAAGPSLVGWCKDFQLAFAVLAGISLIAGLLPIPIWRERQRQFENP